MNLPNDVITLLTRLERAGYHADVVGGPVRDHILGKEPHDFDITTSATPDTVKRIFADMRTVDTGIAHGTVTVVLNGENYEITTYRIDGEYTDSRHPDRVDFTDRIEDDLARRDFTVNAISYNPDRGFTDPFGGTEDIKRRLIRAVGDPVLRFSEDALRILRGIRFAATLGFSIDPPTADAMRTCAHLLPRVSVERVWVELSKLLSGDLSYPVLAEFSDIISIFLPELSAMRLPDRTLFDSADKTARLLALFYLNSRSPDTDFAAAMRRLKTDSKTLRDGTAVLAYLRHFPITDPVSLTRMLSSIGAELAFVAIDTALLLDLADRQLRDTLAELLAHGAVYRISQLAIGGNDLVALGYRGPSVGATLDRLLDLVIRGELSNDRATLLAAAADMR